MKLKSLILGSVAAAGLSTGAFAADLGVLTSLDVCDALGLSGLTISSDTNCLQITGQVDYKFVWGDYKGNSNSTAGAQSEGGGQTIVGPLSIAQPGYDTNAARGVDYNNDWESYVEAYIKFVATADSDFGPAKAVLKIKQIRQVVTINEYAGELGTLGGGSVTTDDTYDGGDNSALTFDEAYVSIGDSTVIMAGKKGSIVNKGDDEPFNWLGLIYSNDVDAGVAYDIGSGDLDTGGHVIQVVSDLGNGVSVGVGLENLDDSNPLWAGTAVGVISYAGEGLSAHVSLLAGGILDGAVEAYAIHAGFTGTFDQFRVRGAFASNYNDLTGDTNWNALASAEATFDMFKIAVSGEAVNTAGTQAYGFGASASATVTDGVTINIGGNWFDSDNSAANTEGYQIAASLSAAVTETLTLTGEVGVYGENATNASVYYGAAQIAWAPGGDFTSSLKGEAYSNGAYKATFKASKAFQ